MGVFDIMHCRACICGRTLVQCPFVCSYVDLEGMV